MPALNEEPQLRFHNDITGEMEESSAGETEVEIPPTFHREEPAISYRSLFIFPRKTVWSGSSRSARRAGVHLVSTQYLDWDIKWKAAGSSGRTDRHSTKLGAPAPTLF